jgi:hypothetical protein
MAVRFALGRWATLMRYMDDGRIETDNNAERALRTVALGRKNCLFAGSDAGGERAAESTAKWGAIQNRKFNTAAQTWPASRNPADWYPNGLTHPA